MSLFRHIPHLAVPYAVPPGGGVIINGAAVYYSCLVLETGGAAPLVMTVTDGPAANGLILDIITVPLSGFNRGQQGDFAIYVETSLRVGFTGAGVPNAMIYAVAAETLALSGDPIVNDLLGLNPQ